VRGLALVLAGLLAASPAFAATQKKPAAKPAPGPIADDLMKPELSVPSLRYMMLPPPAPAPVPSTSAVRKEEGFLPHADVGLGDPNSDLAYGAYQRGLYVAAFKEAKKRAGERPPSPPAMTLLGQLYASGAGVARSPEEAARWYARAVDYGDREAMVALALARLNGDGVEKSETEAAKLFAQAAELDEPEALYNLAVMRLQGAGVARDPAAAVRDMKAAAELGQPEAQYAYAVMLRDGTGLERNPAESALWLGRAAAQEDIPSMVEYAIALFNGKGVAKDEAAAARMFRRAAERGNAIAQNRLARLYANGRGVERDPARAAAWHRLARAQGLNDTWLEGFVGSMSPGDRAAGEKLAAKFVEGFGPVTLSQASAAAKP
jgi:TPR repeat protein